MVMNSHTQYWRASRASGTLGLIWLTGMNATITNWFISVSRDSEEPLKDVFKQTVFVALKAELIGLVINALDGTKIAARSSRQGAMDKEGLGAAS